MGIQVTTNLFQGFLFHPETGSSTLKPRVMPQKIVDRIVNATTEREVAEAWVSLQSIHHCRPILTILAGRVVEPSHHQRQGALPRLPSRAIAGSMEHR